MLREIESWRIAEASLTVSSLASADPQLSFLRNRKISITKYCLAFLGKPQASNCYSSTLKVVKTRKLLGFLGNITPEAILWIFSRTWILKSKQS